MDDRLVIIDQTTMDEKKPPADAKARRKELFDSLHREVEIAEYAKLETGHQRRRTPRSKRAARTKKRKLLEKSDVKERAMSRDDDGGKRLRGSRRAMGDEVIHGSRVFKGQESYAEESDNDQDVMDESDRYEQLDESEVQLDGDIGDDDEEENTELEDETTENQDQPPKKAAGKHTPSKKKKRPVYRMRNFKSARMAERHGDALGAHARGQSLAAVKKLELVAAEAPAAPQVYSTLGMVYESLLSDSRKKGGLTSGEETGEGVEKDGNHKQLELAKKAYGSYHVAAVLCKKDFTFWVRAGDTAKEIADLYTEQMVSADVQNDTRKELRQEKKRWLEEAKKDYTTADNLKPPGIDVPAKLASAHMELGNLSEALTILTDLKNRGASSEAGADETVVRRSEFERSFKAWLLYSDLMLRIGHECTQWNQGVHENLNYMFRRWLRKWSVTFDWQERRLQALALALEAAAGSSSCEHLIQWAQNRAPKAVRPVEAESNDEKRWHLDSYEMGEATAEPNGVSMDGETEVEDDREALGQQESMQNNALWSCAMDAFSQFAARPDFSLKSAREDLLEKNRSELAAFDKETEKRCLLPDSDESRQRALELSALVDSHRKSVVDLIGVFHQHQAVGQSDSRDKAVASALEQLPIAASCGTVCSIASELMMHCLRIELFQGGRLVGEAVSAYLKERGSLLESRIQKNRSFAQRQKSTDESVLLRLESYDEVGADDSEDDADLFLSDDDIIMDSPDESLVTLLKNAILPPDLQFLFALSLLGEGGRAFLARKCLVAVEAIQAEDEETLARDPVDTNVVNDPAWLTFRFERTGPLQKTAAFVFAIDILIKLKKEKECADVMGPLIQRHLDSLRAGGPTMDAVLSETEFSRQATLTRNRIIKLILAYSRIQIENAKSILSTQEPVASEMAQSILERVTPLFQKFWEVKENGSIPSSCIEGLGLLAKTFEVLVMVKHNNGRVTQRILSKLLGILSLFCGVAISDPFQPDVSTEAYSKQWTKLPIRSDWQNPAQQNLSRRAFNLVIACSVPNFSGWETDEFKLDLMKRGTNNQHVCVDLHGERVTGCLSPTVEAELADQWKKLGPLLPDLAHFDFDANLVTAKSSSWYSEVMKHVKENSDPAAVYGEDDGFTLVLSLSRLCLDAASSAASNASKSALIQLAVCVILPVSEFALDQQLWDSPLGKAAVSKPAATFDWNKLAGSVGGRQVEVEKAIPVKRPEPTQKRPLLPSFLKIPVSALLAQWTDGTAPTLGVEAKNAMNKVDAATKQLRACFTEAAVEKGCIQVALALMELVKKNYACNPFLCLHQAVIFASHGSKGGNSDEAFKQGLPKERECTPHEALVIIGHADCLQALYFSDEAIYLCSYVARVCRLHRDKQETDMEWNSKWRAISICVHNLSVSIRTTRSYQEDRPEYWEHSVVEELKQCRADAIALKKTLPEDDTLVDEGEIESNGSFDHDEGQGNRNDYMEDDVNMHADQFFDVFGHNPVNGIFPYNASESSSSDEGEIVSV